MSDPDRSLARQAVDTLVYAPAGLLLTAVEDLPELAAKGRARLEVQVRNAHVVGRFAVEQVSRRLSARTGPVEEPETAATGTETAATGTGAGTGTTTERSRRAAPPEPGPEPVAARPGGAPGTTSATGATAAVSPADAPEPGEAAAGTAALAIPDYDTLSASQVVRRLDGLGSEELLAVYRHESATRGRRTILHRARQLLGSEDPPGR